MSGQSKRSCFVCNNQLKPDSSLSLSEQPGLVSSICKLFKLDNVQVYVDSFGQETVCFKCKEVLHSITALFHKLESVNQQIHQARQLLQTWITETYLANHDDVHLSPESESGSGSLLKTRVELQRKLIGREMCPSDDRACTSTTPGPVEKVEIKVDPSYQEEDADVDDYEEEEAEVYEMDNAGGMRGRGHRHGPANVKYEDRIKKQRRQSKASVKGNSRSRRQIKARGRKERTRTEPTTPESPHLAPSTEPGPREDEDSENSDWEPRSTKKRKSNTKEQKSPKAKTFNCKVCAKPFKTREYAKKHVSTHTYSATVDRPFKCTEHEDCDAEYVTKKGLVRHVKECHFGGVNRPRKSSRRTTTTPLTSTSSTSTPPSLSCAECDRTLKSPYDLKCHMETHKPHDERKHICAICGFGFVERCRLKRHLRVHDPHRPPNLPVPKTPCSVCGLQVVNIRAHMRVHTADKTFLCTQCGSSFRAQKTLIVHSRIHTGEKPYECKVCPMKFRTSHGLSRHVFIHSEERQFTCDYCGKSFRFKSSLTEHLHIHTKVTPFRCNVCGRRYKQQAELRAHLSGDHTADQLDRKKRAVVGGRSPRKRNLHQPEPDLLHTHTLIEIQEPVQVHVMGVEVAEETKLHCTPIQHPDLAGTVLMGYQFQYL